MKKVKKALKEAIIILIVVNFWMQRFLISWYIYVDSIVERIEVIIKVDG